ncbi:hypothetical protein RCC89_03035 [Cytophagaceae bacterium ABcell3]|nr:hypothetical protein RCC89_03035 [Cytophagaceae bacterium ABcell3]
MFDPHFFNLKYWLEDCVKSSLPNAKESLKRPLSDFQSHFDFKLYHFASNIPFFLSLDGVLNKQIAPFKISSKVTLLEKVGKKGINLLNYKFEVRCDVLSDKFHDKLNKGFANAKNIKVKRSSAENPFSTGGFQKPDSLKDIRKSFFSSDLPLPNLKASTTGVVTKIEETYSGSLPFRTSQSACTITICGNLLIKHAPESIEYSTNADFKICDSSVGSSKKELLNEAVYLVRAKTGKGAYISFNDYNERQEIAHNSSSGVQKRKADAKVNRFIERPKNQEKSKLDPKKNLHMRLTLISGRKKGEVLKLLKMDIGNILTGKEIQWYMIQPFQILVGM